MIKVKCSGCGKTIKAADEWAGKQGKCPGCGKPVTILAVTPGPPPKPKSTTMVADPPVKATAVATTPPPLATLPLPKATISNAFNDTFTTSKIDEHTNCPFCGEMILKRA